MKLKIKNLKLENKTGEFGNYRQFVFLDAVSNKWVYANEKRGFTDNFHNDLDLEVDDAYVVPATSKNSGKPYLTIKWPKANEAPRASDAQVLKKLDEILGILYDNFGAPPVGEPPVNDAPPHNDSDEPPMPY